jgi:IS5 family transposase
VVARWVENPYYQHFTGRSFFQHRPPSIRPPHPLAQGGIGEEGVEWLLTKTIEAGRRSGAVEDRSLEQVAVDTTVMEKAIAHPTDSRLVERARAQLVDLAREAGIELRQSYAVSLPTGSPGRPLCPCQAVQAHAQGFADAQKLHRARAARPAPAAP